jgi:hypothetical protein
MKILLVWDEAICPMPETEYVFLNVKVLQMAHNWGMQAKILLVGSV